MGERLRVAEAEVKRLTDVLVDKENYVKLQETIMKGLEAQVKAPPQVRQWLRCLPNRLWEA